jgi:lactate dehydrogenase-like 2-hydroxyacid dehydrogenase
MLLCLTKIDDLPHVESKLRILAEKKNWELVFLNAPTEEVLNLYSKNTKVIFMNPNKSLVTFNRRVLKKFINLEVFCTASTGTIHIDLLTAEELGIQVITIKNHIKTLKKIPSTAELAFALTLDGLRQITKSYNDALKYSSWDFEKYIGKQIKDLKVGVIGYGRLGAIYSKMMKNSGADLYLLDPRISFDFKKEIQKFLSNAFQLDVISLHIHAEGNENFINRKFFNSLAKDVVIINTSRGEIVNHSDLFMFLDKNPHATYCSDVLPEESNSSIREYYMKEFAMRSNVIITQHIGGMSTGARNTAFGLACNLLLDKYGLTNG